ncbi:hypothetical protein ACFQ1E_17495 [Sphingomonas canadensis]|uniref:Uncharacterized protein n=1 Tax=Sphingomonas canadensis TaxID=1219257 RepID=A0ABW3HEP1_9SPHN|nr:hypothetical protein [Sphingomonas canadensis]MCW3837842.1 hypothetical protein [Sphingomonas canadensis]
MPTPWSTEVGLSPSGQFVRVQLLLSTDPGPARGFRPFLEFELDEAHATELLSKLVLTLEELRELQGHQRFVSGPRAV